MFSKLIKKKIKNYKFNNKLKLIFESQNCYRHVFLKKFSNIEKRKKINYEKGIFLEGYKKFIEEFKLHLKRKKSLKETPEEIDKRLIKEQNEMKEKEKFLSEEKNEKIEKEKLIEKSEEENQNIKEEKIKEKKKEKKRRKKEKKRRKKERKRIEKERLQKEKLKREKEK